jgi:hypothetical protein
MARIYHHNDHDGRLAAFWVKKLYEAHNFEGPMPGVEFFEMTYGKDPDVESLDSDEEVWIVDFSFEPEVMQKLLMKTRFVRWIDHHKSAIEKYDKFTWEAYDTSEMLKCLSTKYAACVLTWAVTQQLKDLKVTYTRMELGPFVEGFLSMQEMWDKIPWATKYVGDYDAWIHQYPASKPFVLGLQTEDCSVESVLWKDINCSPMADEITEQIVRDGSVVEKYRTNFNAEYRKSFSYEVKWVTNDKLLADDWKPYNCLVMNLGRSSSLAFGEEFAKYDICVSSVYKKDHWEISLYSDKVDVSKIAMQFVYNGSRGGGHKGAAGFSCKELPPWVVQ